MTSPSPGENRQPMTVCPTTTTTIVVCSPVAAGLNLPGSSSGSNKQSGYWLAAVRRRRRHNGGVPVWIRCNDTHVTQRWNHPTDPLHTAAVSVLPRRQKCYFSGNAATSRLSLRRMIGVR